MFDKRTILFGSEGTAKVFDSAACGELTAGLLLGSHPILLSAGLCNVCDRPACGEPTLAEVPAGIQAAFDEPISLDNGTVRRVYLTLGQFSILRLERDTQLLIPVYDYCVPSKECACERCDADPCEIFQQVTFPVGQFFPPATAGDIDPLGEIRRGCCQ